MPLDFSVHFDYLKRTRQNILRVVKDHSIEQINKIPKGFNNNLIWNLAHCLVTQHLLIYKLSGTEMTISEDLVNAYRKGTQPEGSVDKHFVDRIKKQLIDSSDQLSMDYQNNIFGTYNPYPTSYGITLLSVEEAIAFNNMHEAMHLGTVIALSKFV